MAALVLFRLRWMLRRNIIFRGRTHVPVWHIKRWPNIPEIWFRRQDIIATMALQTTSRETSKSGSGTVLQRSVIPLPGLRVLGPTQEGLLCPSVWRENWGWAVHTESAGQWRESPKHCCVKSPTTLDFQEEEVGSWSRLDCSSRRRRRFDVNKLLVIARVVSKYELSVTHNFTFWEVGLSAYSFPFPETKSIKIKITTSQFQRSKQTTVPGQSVST